MYTYWDWLVKVLHVSFYFCSWTTFCRYVLCHLVCLYSSTWEVSVSERCYMIPKDCLLMFAFRWTTCWSWGSMRWSCCQYLSMMNLNSNEVPTLGTTWSTSGDTRTSISSHRWAASAQAAKALQMLPVNSRRWSGRTLPRDVLFVNNVIRVVTVEPLHVQTKNTEKWCLNWSPSQVGRHKCSETQVFSHLFLGSDI